MQWLGSVYIWVVNLAVGPFTWSPFYFLCNALLTKYYEAVYLKYSKFWNLFCTKFHKQYPSTQYNETCSFTFRSWSLACMRTIPSALTLWFSVIVALYSLKSTVGGYSSLTSTISTLVLEDCSGEDWSRAFTVNYNQGNIHNNIINKLEVFCYISLL